MARRATRRDVIRGACAAGLAPTTGCLGRSRDSILGRLFSGDEPTDEAVVWQRGLDVAPRELVTDPASTALYGSGRRGAPFSFALDGGERWKRDVDGRLAAVTADRVLLVDSSTVTALDAESGSVAWSFETERHEVVQDLSTAASRVYLVGEKRATAETDPNEEFIRLYALDADEGDAVWQRALLPEPDSREWRVHAIDDGVLAAWAGGAITRFDAEGSERWQRAVTLDDLEHYDESDGFTRYHFSPGVLRDGTYYFGIHDGPSQKVYALASGDGAVRWQRAGYRRVQAVDDDRVYCQRAGSHVQRQHAALDADTGAEAWVRDRPSSRVESGGALASNVLYAATVDASDGDDPALGLRAFDAATGERRASFLVPGGGVTAPAVAGDRVYVGTRPSDSATGDGGNAGTLHALAGIHAGRVW